ncbi:MAG: bifunctional lysylphosphatidylglycerol synthetase/lysine--tRNA ligase LysX, partial [Marmoricola sp.]|nr:bifunctional lysylphosphatidylglycerol synthetase/lysine--tRNA ligase LysX [Marmoricola sp.]
MSTVVAIFVWIEPPESHRSGRFVSVLETLNVPVSSSLVSVVVCLLVTQALVGRKRFGWWFVVGFQVLGFYLSAQELLTTDQAPAWAPWRLQSASGRWLDVISLVLTPLILWWLWRIRTAFSGRLQRGSWLAAAGVLALSGALAAITAGVLLWASGAGEPRPFVQRWWGVLMISLGDRDGGEARELFGLPFWLTEVPALIMALGLLASVVTFLRSAKHETDWSGDRELRIRALLDEYGDADSLGYFATRRDKASIFSRDEKAVVTYRVLNGVSLASGDPIGRPESWRDAVGRWMDEAREFGWVPAVLAASEAGARVYAELGLRVLPIGDEAILDPDTFDLRRTAMTPVRRAAQRAARAGITCQVRRQPALDDAELQEVWDLAERWRGDEPERGFSMALNRSQDPADARVLVVTARDTEGRLVGMLSFVPWGRRKISLDVMRRNPEAPNGVIELMVSTVMAQAATLGVRTVSLNFCMFRSVYADAERVGSGALTRLNYSVLGTLDRFWQLERLYVSNQKFGPEWFPRFGCLEDLISLPQVALAMGMAEGFVPQLRLTHPTRLHHLTESEVQAVAALESATPDADTVRPRRSDQTRHRLDRLEALAASGREAYPVALRRPERSIAQLDPGLWERPEPVSVAGRVRAVRDHGGVVFATLTDAGHDVQLLLDEHGARCHTVHEFTALVDVGDLLLVDAVPGHSRNGTPSLMVSRWTMLAKALHPMPFDGLADPETRLRQRSTDLVVNPAEVEPLRARAKVLRSLRGTLDGDGFTEVETPILQTVHGGATARPFRTHSFAHGVDLSLRIAPELALKRLVVGGMGPVYEIGRNFRNEGADATHNPEFTVLEAYLPHADYCDMRRLAQRLVTDAAVAVHG